MRKLPKKSDIEKDPQMSPARQIMQAVTKRALNPKQKKPKAPKEDLGDKSSDLAEDDLKTPSQKKAKKKRIEELD